MSNEEIFTQPVEAYLARNALLGKPPHPVLEKMRLRAVDRPFPIVGPEVGRFFLQLAAIRRPARILELGSGYGYSALWWAFGWREAEIHLTDFDEENLKDARAYAEEASIGRRMHFHQGDALLIGEALDGPFDIIFCDIDKQSYPKAIDIAERKLEPGGILLFDNMLLHGKVAELETEWDARARAVVQTTRRLYADSRWRTSLLPIRDGVLMALRV